MQQEKLRLRVHVLEERCSDTINKLSDAEHTIRDSHTTCGHVMDELEAAKRRCAVSLHSGTLGRAAVCAAYRYYPG